jgi:putative ABC transport system permease protein
MMAHLFKLIWRRKRLNALVILEMAVSFIVLCVVMVWTVYYINNFIQPLGFSYDRVWSLRFHHPWSLTGGPPRRTSFPPPPVPENEEQMSAMTSAINRQMYRALQELPDIEQAAFVEHGPYDHSISMSNFTYRDRTASGVVMTSAHEPVRDVLGLNVVAGRWFEPGDGALNWKPVVVNQYMADALFGTEDPLGKTLEGTEYRVIGVLDAYRKRGELQGHGPAMFRYHDIETDGIDYNGVFLIKVRPGTPPAFEEKVLERMRAIAGDWAFELDPLSVMRQNEIDDHMTTFLFMRLIAAFLMLMVGLGLVGVLWQNVTQRTVEIGLRRALGAAAVAIHRQILGELFVVATFGVLLGLILLSQFFFIVAPLLDMDASGSMEGKIYASGIGLALVMIYGLTLLAGLYPSRLATRIQPAAALHYE